MRFGRKCCLIGVSDCLVLSKKESSVGKADLSSLMEYLSIVSVDPALAAVKLCVTKYNLLMCLHTNVPAHLGTFTVASKRKQRKQS